MKKKSLLASIVVCAAVFLICAVPVLAADETYAAIHGGTVALSHELVMDKNATTVHGAKFKFSVAGSNVKAAGDPVYLVKGPNGATVTESLRNHAEFIQSFYVKKHSFLRCFSE